MTAHPAKTPINWDRVITPAAIMYAQGFRLDDRGFRITPLGPKAKDRDFYQRMCAISGCTPETCEWCRLYGKHP